MIGLRWQRGGGRRPASPRARHWDRARACSSSGGHRRRRRAAVAAAEDHQRACHGDEQHDARDAGHPQPASVVVVGVARRSRRSRRGRRR